MVAGRLWQKPLIEERFPWSPPQGFIATRHACKCTKCKFPHKCPRKVMARGEEKDLKALWEVTEELWGVEGEMVFQNLSQSFSQPFQFFLNLPQPFRTFLKYLSKLVQCSPFQNFFHPFQTFHPFQPFLDLSKRRWNDLAKVEVRQGRGGLEASSGKRQFS